MRVALIALEPDITAQLAGWLGDEGHLPRRFDTVAAFAASDDVAVADVAICDGEHSAAVAAAILKGCRLLVTGGDGVAADARIDVPLRRRAVLGALSAGE
ncbi:MAG: hypothetical protein AAF229_01335 [Pseudomonadota bacterium]